VPTLKVMIPRVRTMCPLKVEESDRGHCPSGILPGVSVGSATAEQSSRQAATLQQSGATKHGDDSEVKAWGAVRWVGRSDSRSGIFNHKLPNWQIPKDGKCCLKKPHPVPNSFLKRSFPTYLLLDTFGGCWTYLG